MTGHLRNTGCCPVRYPSIFAPQMDGKHDERIGSCYGTSHRSAYGIDCRIHDNFRACCNRNLRGRRSCGRYPFCYSRVLWSTLVGIGNIWRLSGTASIERSSVATRPQTRMKKMGCFPIGEHPISRYSYNYLLVLLNNFLNINQPKNSAGIQSTEFTNNHIVPVPISLNWDTNDLTAFLNITSGLQDASGV